MKKWLITMTFSSAGSCFSCLLGTWGAFLTAMGPPLGSGAGGKEAAWKRRNKKQSWNIKIKPFIRNKKKESRALSLMNEYIIKNKNN